MKKKKERIKTSVLYTISLLLSVNVWIIDLFKYNISKVIYMTILLLIVNILYNRITKEGK